MNNKTTRKSKLLIISVCILLVSFFEINVFAAETADTFLRVGLVYSKKPASIVKISSGRDMTLAIYNEGTSQKIFSTNESSLSVMKDVYYTQGNDNNVKISTWRDSEISSWHVQVDNEVSTYEEADNYVTYFKNKGIDVFPYYNGNWSVITGFGDNASSTDKMISDLGKAHPEVVFSKVNPDSRRILVLSDKKKPILAFSSSTKELAVLPLNGSYLSLETDKKRMYRGNLNFYRLSSGSLTVVNDVPVQHYLYGVVPAEIGASSPLEAIKAQAVAARNYAFQSRGKHSSEKFDLCNTVDCQVYAGVNSEESLTNRGVDETNGKTLKYKGKLASIYYFSSTGGERTEDVENVWGSKVPYLVSVESKYETGGTYHFTWDYEYTAAKIKEFLANKNIDIGNIKDIQIIKYSEAGRAVEVKVFGDKGEKTIQRESIRLTFKLDSQFFKLTTDADSIVKGKDSSVQMRPAGKKIITANGIKTVSTSTKIGAVVTSEKKVKYNFTPSKFIFNGKGWGHSVGMSQDGAIGMAKAGYKYDSILTHYFPGTVVE